MLARLAAMVKKDLLRHWRSPLAMAITLAFPLVFALVLTLAFGGDEPELPKVELLIEDRDGGLAGRLVAGAFSAGEAGRYFAVEQVGEEGRERLEQGDASALLVIPEGFGEAVIDGRPATLELVRNPAQGILPEVAEQAATVLADLLSAGSRLLRGPLDEVSALADSGAAGPTDETVAAISVDVNRLLTASSDYLFPPAITLETVAAGEGDGDGEEATAGDTPSVFVFVLPGLAVLALFMVGDRGMKDLLTEARMRTLGRQLAGPIGAGTLIAGKALSTAALAALALVILAAVAAVAAPVAIDPLAFVVLSAALVVAVTGFAAAAYGVAKNERQGSTLAGILTLAMAFLGGSFVPVSSFPPTLQRIAPASLLYWGTDGYRELIRGGGGLAAVALNIGVLVAIGAALLVVGAMLLRRKLGRGAA